PPACAVALASAELLENGGLEAARRIEGFWRQALAEAWNWPGVRAVRVQGTVAAVELAVPGTAGDPADLGPRLPRAVPGEGGPRLRRACLEEGVLLRPLGPVLYALPPLCSTPGSLERIVHAMRRATAATVP